MPKRPSSLREEEMIFALVQRGLTKLAGLVVDADTLDTDERLWLLNSLAFVQIYLSNEARYRSQERGEDPHEPL